MSIITLLGELDKAVELPVTGIKNASISIVHHEDGKYRVNSVDDISYLDKGEKEIN